MGKFLIFTLLLIPLGTAQNQNLIVSEKSDLAVLAQKWTKTRQLAEKMNASDPPPAQSVFLPGGKNPQRMQRVNETGGARDPAADTTDGRAAALEKAVRDARTPPPKMIDGFAYKLKVKNESAKPIEVVFWEYQFIDAADPTVIARRQFLCGLDLKPAKDKEVTAFSLSGPSEVVSAESLADKTKKPPWKES